MKILAIESSGLVASIAVYWDGIMQSEYTVNYKKTHSQTLLPMIEEVSRMTELDLNELDAIAVSSGPGSFTGLRIGAATAKGLGLALDKPLIGVPTLEGLAYNLCMTTDLICPIMDARRSQVYTGIYCFEDENFRVIKDQCAIAIEEIISEVNALARPVIFLGDGVPVFSEVISDKITVPYRFAPPHMAYQRAGAVCERAAHYFEQGQTIHAREFAPDYLRVSQAERERNERLKKGENIDA